MSWQYHPKIECDYFIEKNGTWADIASQVRRIPRKYKEKSDIPLWSFYTIRRGVDAEKAKDGKHLRACNNNMVDVCALQIDYDDGMVSIQDFVEDHRGTVFAAYTSPGHKVGYPKFRVIIPLAKPLPNAYLASRAVREYLLAMFPGCDQSTINTFRKQRMPAQPLGGDEYQQHVEEGERLALDLAHIAELYSRQQTSSFSADEIDEDADLFDLPLDAADKLQEQRRLKTKYAKELADLEKHGRGGGVVHAALTRIITGLVNTGLSRERLEAYLEERNWLTDETMKIADWNYRRGGSF